MKILHTSDWHLGCLLYGKSRYSEFCSFLDWLTRTIEDENIDTLLVAGDVFDTTTPSNRAQELYYRFLCRVSKSCCHHIVIIAGNHDSPSFLNAPREILSILNVHIVSSASNNLDDEVIVLYNDNKPIAIICAVPYLRDKDIRMIEPGESIDDKNKKLVEGLKKHYEEVCNIAKQKQIEFESANYAYIPIIAMGHLFTTGAKSIDGDGVRDLYVGSQIHINKDIFPSSIDYYALGHLHVPQTVGNVEHIRYCGSPIPMGYGESNQEKKVVIIEFNGNKPNIKELSVPCFQQLAKVTGSLDEICTKLEKLKSQKSSAWLEIEYRGDGIVGDSLHERVDRAIEGSKMQIRCIKNQPIINNVIGITTKGETLDDLSHRDVFERCLKEHPKYDHLRKELISSYDEIIKSIHEEDINSE